MTQGATASTQIWMLNSVQEQLEDAIDRAVAAYRAELDNDLFTRFTGSLQVESPLEAVFIGWFWALRVTARWEKYRLTTKHAVSAGGRTRRLDLVVSHADGDVLRGYANVAGRPYPLIAVELDGHDFHERTRDQVIDRNTRDRDLHECGWTVLHYSGSELFRDPEGCVKDAMKHAITPLHEFETDVYWGRRAAEQRAGYKEPLLTGR